jgi:ubiquitin C-terminal hydrolase
VQHDADEFLRVVLDHLQSELRSDLARRTPSAALHNRLDAFGDGGALPAPAARAGPARAPASPSQQDPVAALYGGTKVRELTCAACGHRHAVTEAFVGPVTLEIPAAFHASGGASSRSRRGPECPLGAMFAESFHAERLEGYKCERCGQAGQVDALVTLGALPPVLVLHLNRTSWKFGGRKLPTPVAFPLHDLQPRAHIPPAPPADAPAAAELPYELFGVVEHQGRTPREGHYTAFARNTEWDVWLHFNDKRVRIVLPEEVAQAQAAELVYVRKDWARDASAADHVEEVVRKFIGRPKQLLAGARRVERDADDDDSMAGAAATSAAAAQRPETPPTLHMDEDNPPPTEVLPSRAAKRRK